MERPALEALLGDIDWSRVEADPDEIGAAAQNAADLLGGVTDPASQAILGTLVCATQLWINQREAPERPFGPTHVFDALDADALRDLADAAGTIPSLLVRARIVDVAWCRRVTTHHQTSASIAAYVEHARGRGFPRDTVVALRRAATLVAMIQGKKPQHLAVLDEATALVRRAVAAGEDLCAIALMELLQEHYDSRCAKELADVAGRLADAARCDHVENVVRIPDLKERWHQLDKNDEAARSTRVAVARALSAHAEALAARDEVLVAASFQGKVVEAWRRAGRAEEEVKAARVRLQEIQRRIPDTFSVHEQRISLESCALEAIARVSGQPLAQALSAVAQLQNPPSRSQIEGSARRSFQNSIVYRLFPRVVVSSTGRTVRRGDGEDDEATVGELAHQHLVYLQRMVALGAVVPAARQIQLEHAVTVNDMLPLTSRNPFVPPGRERVFARGLVLGFQGDWDLAGHLLLPQFENALRHMLERRGAVVTSLPKSQEQNELSLNQLFECPECKVVFGEDEHWELESFLVNKRGANLRNEAAHGLLDDGHEADFAYFWWKTLRYVVIFHLLQEARLSRKPHGGGPAQGG